jgi:hypothetical protein
MRCRELFICFDVLVGCKAVARGAGAVTSRESEAQLPAGSWRGWRERRTLGHCPNGFTFNEIKRLHYEWIYTYTTLTERNIHVSLGMEACKLPSLEWAGRQTNTCHS